MLLKKLRSAKYLIIGITVISIIMVININYKESPMRKTINENVNQYFDSINKTKIDWIDHKFQEIEKQREGTGEQGRSVELSNKIEHDLAETYKREYSYNALVSQKISFDRSLQDTRHEMCLSINYRSDLPAVSVIILFRNEDDTVIKRTVHSIVNRTPQKLLNEIILVDDNSSKEFLGKPLDAYMKDNFKDKVKIIHLQEQHGLMRARMKGIKASISDIVVVMDGHMEVNVNWLPPLIEPIYENNLTMTEPNVDRIDCNTFEYTAENGYKGGFNWYLSYYWYGRSWKKEVSDNYEQPVILGAVFAINKHYFWHLGGFDEGLKVWGGEQFELSWKVWMCGGQVLGVPCSRIGHNYKDCGHHPFLGNSSYVKPNLRRVIDVWTDEYKQIFYSRGDFMNYDPGNLSKQIDLRKKLHCKSFKWYLETILPDLLETFPIDPFTMVAFGVVQSVAHKNYCIDTLTDDFSQPLGLYLCDTNFTTPRDRQYFLFTKKNEIRLFYKSKCWDNFDREPENTYKTLKIFGCHKQRGRQEFHYNIVSNLYSVKLFHTKTSQQIKNAWGYCLEGDLTVDVTQHNLYFGFCNDTKITQKWIWGYVNTTKLVSLENS